MAGAASWLFTLFENYSFVTIYILLLPKIILKMTEIFGQKYEIKKVECWEIVFRKKTWNSSKFQDKKHCCRMHFDDVQVSYPPMWLVLF